MKIFEVGGCVRDEILGVPSKDIDFTVVLEDWELGQMGVMQVTPFEFMTTTLRDMGFKIFLETPEFLTVRAQFPKNHKVDTSNIVGVPILFGRENLTADFVLARSEGGYTDGRRPDEVVPGTLEDDLARRDFTMNAIARDAAGNFVDPFGGRQDISKRLIRAVGDPQARLREDGLRAVRALRFAITKGFRIEGELSNTLHFDSVVHDLVAFKVADERIADEVGKMFRHDTLKSLILLNQYPALTGAIFSGRLHLDASLKTKGRGK